MQQGINVEHRAKLQKGAAIDSGSWLVSEAGALLSLEHPHRNGELKPMFQPNNHALLALLTQRTNDLHVLVEERVVAIQNPAT